MFVCFVLFWVCAFVCGFVRLLYCGLMVLYFGVWDLDLLCKCCLLFVFWITKCLRLGAGLSDFG